MSGRGDLREIGSLGETAVCALLERQGAEILCRNYTVRGGEIDVIARLGEWLLFVEVKTRKTGALVSGAAAVDTKKQRFIIRAAEQYLLRFPNDLQPRFDVAEVEYSGQTVRHITYFPAAFDASDYR
ncbi:MAG: YraN family protein [Oscillospiraceae bacterium]|nr:YraN family protein [Oscillospiraceae bacterium]